VRVIINDKEYRLPSSLSEITLTQRIGFQRDHGDLLNEMYNSIKDIKDEDEREIEFVHFQLEQAARSIAYFTGLPVESVKTSEHIDTLINIYFSSIKRVFEDEQKEINNPEYEFVWRNEEWVLHPPELKNGAKMAFGEFIESKQIVQDMIGLGKNRWECLIPLCTIFLRKKDEEYEESFMFEGSERKALMEQLPLNIALQVGFFLNNSLSSYVTTFQSSSLQGLKELGNTPRTISRILAG
jgi:hypothetical protein